MIQLQNIEKFYAHGVGKTFILRRILNPMGPQDAIEFLLDKFRQSKNNADFFQSMNQ